MGKIILIVLMVISVVFTSKIIISKTPTDTGKFPPTEMILYYGDTCPHCKDLEEYAQKNGVEQRINFIRKEIFRNQTNNNELTRLAEICKIKELGVPLFWTGETCLIGNDQIIEFWEKR